MKNKIFLIFSLIFIFEFAGGLYYCWSEYKSKPNFGFDPFARGHNYIFEPTKEKQFGDRHAYNIFAYDLIERGDFYNPNTNAKSAYVTPGLPIYLAIIYKIFGYGFIPVLFFNAFLLTLSYYLLYLICLQIFDKKTAYASIILSVINIRMTYNLGSIETEFLFVFLLTLSMYVLILILKRGRENIIYYIILGIILGFDTLVRPVLLPYIGILLIILFLTKIKTRYISLTFIILSMIISIWLIRNYLIFGSILFSTSSLLGGLWIDYESYRNISFFSSYYLSLHNLSDPIIVKALNNCPGDPFIECYWKEASSFFKDWVYNNFWFYLKICIWRFKALLLPFTNDMSLRNSILSTMVWTVISLPSIYVLKFISKNKIVLIIFILSLSLLIAPSLSVVDPYLRYQLPTQFLLIPLSAYTWVKIYNKIRRFYAEK